MDKWARINYQPCLPLGKNGSRITASKSHALLSRKVATEGIVLLKNENNVLPLDINENIAIFGKAQFDYVKGGGGSGDVHSPYVINIYQGLKSKGYKIFEELSSYYNSYVQNRYDLGDEVGNFDEPELPLNLLNSAKNYTRTAIITICRHSKEGKDYTISEKGFNLTDSEVLMINAVKENFDKVIAIINSGSIIDSTWFHSDSHISSAIMAWQGGMEGGNAVADIISGDEVPSGKLVEEGRDTLRKAVGSCE